MLLTSQRSYLQRASPKERASEEEEACYRFKAMRAADVSSHPLSGATATSSIVLQPATTARPVVAIRPLLLRSLSAIESPEITLLPGPPLPPATLFLASDGVLAGGCRNKFERERRHEEEITLGPHISDHTSTHGMVGRGVQDRAFAEFIRFSRNMFKTLTVST